MKKFVRDTDSNFVKIEGDQQPYEVPDKGHLMPGVDNPNRDSSFLIASGWPLKGIWPSVQNKSRFYIDETILTEDLEITSGLIRLHTLPLHPTDPIFTCNYQMSIGSLSCEWDVLFPKAKLSNGSNVIEEAKESLIGSEISDLYRDMDFGIDSVDLSSVINHYAVVNYAVERGRGYASVGYFYVDNPGDWSFAVDGQDVIEVMVDGSVVYSRYNTGGASGTQDKSGIISLTNGWKKIWSYCSQSLPSVWYQRPGDATWSSLNNSLSWATPGVHYMPTSLSLEKLGSTLRSTLSYNTTNSVVLDVPISEFVGGNLELLTDTEPKAQAYYTENWRNSTVEGNYSDPPSFQNIRVFTKFHPTLETLTQNGITVTEFTPFLFSLDFTNWFRYTAGVGFEVVIINNVTNLREEGNTLLEVTDIPTADWEAFLGTENFCWMMFTGQAPIFLTSISESLNLASNEYGLVTLENIANRTRVDKDEL